MENEAVVLFSGGQDSTTCLLWALKYFDKVYPVIFDYGQMHSVEQIQAKKIAEVLCVEEPIHKIPVEALKQFKAAALTNTDIEVEANASEGSGNTWAETHNLPSTFVPGRNLIFLSLAGAYAAQRGVKKLVTGVCEADDSGYPDCRKKFIGAFEYTLSLGLGDTFIVHAPLLTLNKARTFKLAEILGGLDLVLEHTHTCYKGDRSNRFDWGYGCGECPACLERAKGWKEYCRGGLDDG